MRERGRGEREREPAESMRTTNQVKQHDRVSRKALVNSSDLPIGPPSPQVASLREFGLFQLSIPSLQKDRTSLSLLLSSLFLHDSAKKTAHLLTNFPRREDPSANSPRRRNPHHSKKGSLPPLGRNNNNDNNPRPRSTTPGTTRSMAPSPRSALPLLGLLVISSLAAALAGDFPNAYEMLEMYGFPRGILPEGVESYVLREDRTFEVHLGGRGDCNFAVEGGYQLNYKRKITGRLDEASGALRDLKGVSVKVIFVWFGIGEVIKSGGELSFYVGPLSASFPLSNFEECPHCRCGFCASAAAMVADS